MSSAEDFTLATVPALYARRATRHDGIDDCRGIAGWPARAVRAPGGGGPGRRAVAAQLPQAGRGAAARPAFAAAQSGRGIQHARGRGGAREDRARQWSAASSAWPRTRPPSGSAAYGSKPTPTGRRRSRPSRVVEIARAAKKDEALAGLERWKARHPDVRPVPGARRRAGRLDARPLHDLDAHPRQPDHVPEEPTPAQEPLELDYDPWAGFEWPDRAGQPERAPRKKKES